MRRLRIVESRSRGEAGAKPRSPDPAVYAPPLVQLFPQGLHFLNK